MPQATSCDVMKHDTFHSCQMKFQILLVNNKINLKAFIANQQSSRLLHGLFITFFIPSPSPQPLHSIYPQLHPNPFPYPYLSPYKDDLSFFRNQLIIFYYILTLVKIHQNKSFDLTGCKIGYRQFLIKNIQCPSSSLSSKVYQVWLKLIQAFLSYVGTNTHVFTNGNFYVSTIIKPFFLLKIGKK